MIKIKHWSKLCWWSFQLFPRVGGNYQILLCNNSVCNHVEMNLLSPKPMFAAFTISTDKSNSNAVTVSECHKQSCRRMTSSVKENAEFSIKMNKAILMQRSVHTSTVPLSYVAHITLALSSVIEDLMFKHGCHWPLVSAVMMCCRCYRSTIVTITSLTFYHPTYSQVCLNLCFYWQSGRGYRWLLKLSQNYRSLITITVLLDISWGRIVNLPEVCSPVCHRGGGDNSVAGAGVV